ncbi:MAG: response regulator [bacterium]
MSKKDRLSKGLLKLSELAEKANVTLGTIRHYVNLGLIKPSGITPGRFRLFDEKTTVDRIIYVRKLVAEGKGLDEIKEMDLEHRPAKEILVVDDDIEVRDLIKDLLKDKIEVNIKTAFDGFIAGKLLGEYVPDLVILDLHLPGMDGFKVCENLRKDPQFTRTKVLAITGYASEESEEKILLAGANAYLTKPFNTNELLQVIKELLNIH